MLFYIMLFEVYHQRSNLGNMANPHLQIYNIFENGISSVMKRERPTRRTMSNSVLLGLFKTGDDLF